MSDEDEVVVKIKVTLEGFDEHFSIDEWFNFDSITYKELYEKMIHFVVDENGEPVTPEAARQLFRQIKKKEWRRYVNDFYKSLSEAFVSPTNGGS